jgi:hypothetical protein
MSETQDRLRAALIGARDAMKEASRLYTIAADRYSDAIDCISALSTPQPAVTAVTVDDIAEIISDSLHVGLDISSRPCNRCRATAATVLARLNITPAVAKAAKEADAAPGGAGKTLGEMCETAYYGSEIGESFSDAASAVVAEFVNRLDVDELEKAIQDSAAIRNATPWAMNAADVVLSHLRSIAAHTPEAR